MKLTNFSNPFAHLLEISLNTIFYLHVDQMRFIIIFFLKNFCLFVQLWLIWIINNKSQPNNITYLLLNNNPKFSELNKVRASY